MVNTLRKTSPSYILNLPLTVETWQEHILNKRFEVARQLYNACLGEAMGRFKKLRQDKRYWYWVNREQSKERTLALKELNAQYTLSEYSLHTFITPMKKHFEPNLDSNTAQKIATRAWKTFERYRFGNARRVNFKRKGDLDSVEGKSNTSGIRFKDNHLNWLSLKIPVTVKAKDQYAHIALLDRVKYCRILRKTIRGNARFFLQLVLEGTPPIKVNQETGEIKHARNEGRVGIDIGTQTVAIVSKEQVRLLELAPNVANIDRMKKVLQRKLDRQRRANNPLKYNADGTINQKNKEKWLLSKNYLKTRYELADINRKIADVRKRDHNKLANWLLSLGDDIKVEQMSFHSLQKRAKKTSVNPKTGKNNRKKRFGKSISNKAPAMFLSILDCKLRHENNQLKKINTFGVRASQYNHFTNEYVKKSLAERWNLIDGNKIQRDLYSAFLIMNVSENLNEINRELCDKSWGAFCTLHDGEILRLQAKKTKISSFGI